MKTPELNRFAEHCQQRTEAALERFLPSEKTLPVQLHQAMRYAVLGGGKRIRPLLVYAAGQATGASEDALDIAACSVECIHSYSLLHDDLPAMDDDDLRRGKPTCHKVYGEAEAILAGDALQALAFFLLAHADMGAVAVPRRLQMIELLSQASGSRGMVGGQSLDLAATGDILDVTGNTAQLGKEAGADSALNKPTYPSLLGLAGARERARELHQAALDSLDGLHENAEPLRWLARYIVARAT